MAKHYKMKTNKSAAKRFSATASGRLKRKKAGMRHFMRRKKSSTKRGLRSTGYVSKADEKRIKQLIPYA
jgi:large subunit ribosomal protein L35